MHPTPLRVRKILVFWKLVFISAFSRSTSGGAGDGQAVSPLKHSLCQYDPRPTCRSLVVDWCSYHL